MERRKVTLVRNKSGQGRDFDFLIDGKRFPIKALSLSVIASGLEEVTITFYTQSSRIDFAIIDEVEPQKPSGEA